MPSAAALREPACAVDVRARWLWTAQGLGLAVLGALALGVGLPLLGPAWLPTWSVVPLLGLGVTLAVVGAGLRYRWHRYEVTPEAVYVQTGWWTREQRLAPLARVQTVDRHETALGRALGLTSLTLTTASAAGPLRIDGLRREVAAALARDVLERAGRGGDGTDQHEHQQRPPHPQQQDHPDPEPGSPLR